MTYLQDRLTHREIIARGNFAASYKAVDVSLGRTVFLKVLHANFSTDPDIRKRFEREARAAARLDHPSLVRLYELGEDPSEGMYMIFEWVEGESLATKLKREKILSLEQTRNLTLDMLEGLTVLHSAGIVHRDIKPDNILIGLDGGAKLTDYSLAVPVDEPRMTHHRAIIGTPAYMSPEQAAGKQPDERTDLFSLGVVLWETVTGDNPFWSDDLIESLRRVRQIEPDYESPTFAACASDLRTLIHSCLAKDASARPRSALDALKLIGREKATRHSKGGRAWIIVGAAVTLAGLLILVITRAAREPIRFVSLPLTKPLTTESPLSTDTADTGNATPERHSEVVPPRTAAVREHVTDEQSVPAREVPIAAKKVVPFPDSVSVILHVKPWAHVFLNDRDLGTTPFRGSIMLPTGNQRLSFQNAELPRVTADFEIMEDGQRLEVDLAKYVSMLEISVSPWGHVYVDNVAVGITPLKRPVFLVPGNHMVRISHPSLAPLEETFYSRPGDTLMVVADMDHATLTVKRADEAHR